MKKLLLLTLALAAQQSYACMPVYNSMICAGDTVYKGTNYSQGATVVEENPNMQQVTIRSKSSGSLYVENIRDLDIASGCLGESCVGDKVLKGTNYSQGATVIGVNLSGQTVTVRSLSSGSLYVERAEELDRTKGCLENVCMDERLYKGTNYSQGVNVVGINSLRRTLTVRSASSGTLYLENLTDLDVAKGCLGNVCVNDRVFKNAEYSKGATVLAINLANYTATIRSLSSGSLYSESIYNLQGGSNNQPQWPTPTPPREPQYPNPTPPRDPQWPMPTPPREPQRPAPRPTLEQCTVNRFDPSGLFISSYSRTGYSRNEACRDAADDCSRDLKGRQTCNVAR